MATVQYVLLESLVKKYLRFVLRHDSSKACHFDSAISIIVQQPLLVYFHLVQIQ